MDGLSLYPWNKSPIGFVWSQSLTIFKLNVFWWDVVGIPSWWGGVQTVVLGYFKASFKERDRNLISAVFKILTLLNKEIHEGSNFEAFLNTVICRLRVPPPSSLPPPPPSVKSPSVVGLPTRKQKSASDYNVTPDISSPPATNISIPHNSIYYDVLKLINN